MKRVLIPNDPKTSTMAAIAITIVSNTPECKIDYKAKLRPKYIKNLNIHQYINTKVIFLSESYLKRCKKLYYFIYFLTLNASDTSIVNAFW
jgi:hypothetical protein